MNNNAPYKIYVGLDSEGNLAMFLTEYQLSVLGSRLLKPGQKFPESVYDLCSDGELSRDAVSRAINDCQRFLNNEQDSHATPVFGEAPDKPKRKKHT